MDDGKSDRTKATEGINRREFLKRGGAALAGIAGGSMLAGFSPDTRSASAQLHPFGPIGYRSFIDPLLFYPVWHRLGQFLEPNVPPDKVPAQAFYGSEDALRFEYRSGAEVSPPLGQNETLIELRRQVGWDKRVEVVLGGKPTGRRVLAADSPDCKTPGPTMRLCTPDTPTPGPGVSRADTIMFSKPKWFGEWTNMYHIDPAQFWYQFAGRKVTICWITDNDRNYFQGVFRTGFEIGDLLPDWRNFPDALWNVADLMCSDSSTPDLPERHVGGGLLEYRGTYTLFAPPFDPPTPGDLAVCFFRVFDVTWLIRPNTWLLYWMYPKTDLGRFVSVDLLCTNGERLIDSGAVDIFGASMHPTSGHRPPPSDPDDIPEDIPLDEWRPIFCNVGRFFAGRTVDMIYVTFMSPVDRIFPVGSLFRGYIDTIYLGETPFGKLGLVDPIVTTRSNFFVTPRSNTYAVQSGQFPEVQPEEAVQPQEPVVSEGVDEEGIPLAGAEVGGDAGIGGATAKAGDTEATAR